MARRRIPQVIDGHLQQIDTTDGSLPAIVVGSAAWYAYRTQHGQLHKAYLGKPEELTRERLNKVAAALGADATPIARGASPQTPPDSTTRAHEQALLATKLFIPPPAPTLVARPRLIAQLTAGVAHAVTLVSAPAGWGKTTLLSTWHADLSGRGYPFAWVSLDAGDNDPVRFWTYVLVALNTLCDGVSDTALTLLRSPQPPPVESVLTSLLNALIALPMDAVLVLDDYHVIEAQPIHHALTFLLKHLPPRLHLVIATRVDPPLLLARLRVRGALTEVRMPYRILCNGVKREYVSTCPDQASRLFCSVPLHKIRYGIHLQEVTAMCWSTWPRKCWASKGRRYKPSCCIPRCSTTYMLPYVMLC
jgi:hypothetical protein